MSPARRVWTPVWIVNTTGEVLDELVASNVDALDGAVSLRHPKSRRVAQRISRPLFQQRFGRTPAEAIDKYVRRQYTEIGNLEAQIQLRRLNLQRADALRTETA